jgi:hypothetical protein
MVHVPADGGEKVREAIRQLEAGYDKDLRSGLRL